MMIIITMICILISTSAIIYYMLKQESIWDQILAMNVIANLVVLLILLFSLYQKLSIYIDIAILYAFLSFVGSLFIIIFVYRRGDL